MRVMFEGYPSLLQRMKNMGFVVFESRDWDLNIIGERNPNGEANKFDDWIHVIYKNEGKWEWQTFQCTTDAGKFYLERGNTAILMHNKQYRGVYKIGLHRGQYEALVQRGGEVSVWRDRNKDCEHDFGINVDTGYFGINIHRANADMKSHYVNKWSAGCQVIADPNDFKIFMSLCRRQILETGFETFSYTLLMGE